MRRLRWLSVLGAVVLSLVVFAATGQTRVVPVATFMPPDLPEGITFDQQGNIYVSMAFTGELRRIAPNSTQSSVATFRPGEGGFLVGLTTDPAGNVYAALASMNAPGTDTHGVWRVSPAGEKQLVAALPAPGIPNDPKFDARGRLFVSDSGRRVI